MANSYRRHPTDFVKLALKLTCLTSSPATSLLSRSGSISTRTCLGGALCTDGAEPQKDAAGDTQDDIMPSLSHKLVTEGCCRCTTRGISIKLSIGRLGGPFGGKMSGQPEIGAMSTAGQSVIWAPEGPSFSFPCTSNASQLLSVEQDWTFALSSCDAPSRVENSNPPGLNSATASCQLLRLHSILPFLIAPPSYLLIDSLLASVSRLDSAICPGFRLALHVLPGIDIIVPSSSIRDGATWSI